jgi:hypothetical protein
MIAGQELRTFGKNSPVLREFLGRTSIEYVGYIVRGLREHGVATQYAGGTHDPTGKPQAVTTMGGLPFAVLALAKGGRLSLSPFTWRT